LSPIIIIFHLSLNIRGRNFPFYLDKTHPISFFLINLTDHKMVKYIMHNMLLDKPTMFVVDLLHMMHIIFALTTDRTILHVNCAEHSHLFGWIFILQVAHLGHRLHLQLLIHVSIYPII
ncbi:hypothetical protein ACJX0J_036099, partial [Zea mays]